MESQPARTKKWFFPRVTSIPLRYGFMLRFNIPLGHSLAFTSCSVGFRSRFIMDLRFASVSFLCYRFRSSHIQRKLRSLHPPPGGGHSVFSLHRALARARLRPILSEAKNLILALKQKRNPIVSFRFFRAFFNPIFYYST